MGRIIVAKPKLEVCPVHIQLEKERFKLEGEIKMLGEHGLQAPRAIERLVRVSNRLSECYACGGNCRE